MKKGFTLIELLIVIAILAVLATAVVLVINPAELIKQARDSTRISDLAALNSAIALYLSDVASPKIAGPSTACTSATARCTASTTSPFVKACIQNATTTVDGNGWVLIKFTDVSAGSPLARLPLDPVNDSTNYYAYGCGALNSTSYEIDAQMESAKFAGGGGDVENKDGGSSSTIYEVGNYLTE